MYLFIDKQKTDFSEFDNLIPETEDVIKKQQMDSLFVFNPNTLNDKGWSMLGLSEKQISIFRNYQSSGIVFYSNEDLSKCYAISDDFVNLIISNNVIVRDILIDIFAERILEIIEFIQECQK